MPPPRAWSPRMTVHAPYPPSPRPEPDGAAMRASGRRCLWEDGGMGQFAAIAAKTADAGPEPAGLDAEPAS